jgi:hypothetical protein
LVTSTHSNYPSCERLKDQNILTEADKVRGATE